ncbi:MAG: nucleotide sugar dehydrogenase [Lachnospiraceae bacterium]|nr:nucleotide sugar dehydrogenase [Lachnospiraceae bacterium]
MNNKYKIVVVGIGYVGLSNAVLLAQNNSVIISDIVKEKVDLVNNRFSPFKDDYISKYLIEKDLDLRATLVSESIFKDCDFIIIATPTNYDEKTKCFNTESIESTLTMIENVGSSATIIIKSTIPFGYTDNIRLIYKNNTILNSPEFLREGKALYDNLHPSRIVIGHNQSIITDYERASEFANLLQEGAIDRAKEVLIVGHREAECIKLFSNTYLAMRVSFFNELDSFAYQNNLNSTQIIEGISSDPRIGKNYNNPSFGYGGYCLPKDAKQLSSSMQDTPNSLIKSIPEANAIRKKFICDEVIKLLDNFKNEEVTVGIYRLVMKAGSDNFRESSIIDVVKMLKENNIKMLIYEPLLKDASFNDIKVTKDLNMFKKICNLIVSNRFNKDLIDVRSKVFTRDIYEEN